MSVRWMGCVHTRCGNREFHFAPDHGRAFGPKCEPFKLGPNECECRVPAAHGTLPAKDCYACGGTGYIRKG